jgi:hypothetical protein
MAIGPLWWETVGATSSVHPKAMVIAFFAMILAIFALKNPLEKRS